MPSPEHPDSSNHAEELASIQATVARLEALIATSHFESDEKREALLSRLEHLNREIVGHTGQEIPDSLHEALQKTEGLAVSRLLGPNAASQPGSDGSGGMDLRWRDELESIESALEQWEARHPNLCAAFLRFTDILSKIGV